MTHISYLRVSTSRQGESGLGLEAQREAVRKHLATNGEILSAEYQEVETGKGSNALSSRPQLLAALEHARRAKMTVVVAKLDRLTRSARLLLELLERSSGVDIAFCDLPQIPTGPVGRFMITQLAAVAEFEAGMISERTKVALAAAKARGTKLGVNGSVLAAQRKREAVAHALLLAPNIGDAYRAGHTTLRAIAQYLSDQGVATRDGGDWHPATVQRLIRRLPPLASGLPA